MLIKQLRAAAALQGGTLRQFADGSVEPLKL